MVSTIQHDALETDLKAVTDHYMETVERADPEAVQETYLQIQGMLETAAEQARDELAAMGLEVEDKPIRFDPTTYGSEYTDDAIVVGKFTEEDRHYPVMNLGHEMIHQYVAEEKEIPATHRNLFQEEALAKTWDLYKLGILDDREDCEEIISHEEELYNEHDGVGDTYGTRMAKQTRRYLDWLEKDFDGQPSDGMGALIEYVDEFYLNEPDDWSGSLSEAA